MKLLYYYEASRSKTRYFNLNPEGAKSGKPGRAKLLGAHCGIRRARTAVGQNGRGTLWNDEGTNSCAGQNGQHAPNPGAHLYRDTHRTGV